MLFSNLAQTLVSKLFLSPDIFTESNTVQKIRFSIKDLFSKCDQIRSFLIWIWSHLLKKSLMVENFIFCAV